MAALPQNSTARMKVIYSNAIHQHDTVIRLTDDSALADGMDVFEAFATALNGQFADTTVLDVQLASAGSDLFFPVAGASLIGFNWGGASATVQVDATFAQVSGRSIGGRKAKFYLFGWSDVISNYRLTGTENASVTTAVNALNAATTSFVAIDGETTVWKTYLNIKTNDHWVHKAR